MNNKIQFALIFFFLLLAVYLGYDMYQLSQQKLLWGYRPLFFLLSSWGFIVMLLRYFIAKSLNSWRWFGLSTLSGILLGLGFPEIIPFPFLMFIGFVPLLVMESEISQLEKGTGKKLLFYAYHAFVTWNIISTYWVANAAMEAGLFAILVNSILMCIPFWLFHKAKKVMPNLAYFALVIYWITFEYIHLNWDLSWPWLTLGNSFAEYPSLIQWYEYTGHLGGTLWILVINVLIYQFWKKQERGRRGIMQLIGIVALPMILSLIIYYSYEEKGNPVEVAVVQPNYEPHHVKFTISEREQIEHYLELSEKVVNDQTDYLVFPESSFGYTETHVIDQHPAILRLRAFLNDYPHLNLVMGMNAFTEFRPDEPLTPNTRVNIRKNGDTIRYEVLNIATQLSSKAENLPIYKKSKLVPGPEIFPYQQLLAPFKPIVDKLGGTTAGVGTQLKRSVFSSQTGKVAPVICYESVYGEYFTGYINAGAEAAFIVTNDGWWDNTAGHRQHLHFASLRAIETRRAIARSANSGISAFINQKGDISGETKYGEVAAIKQTIQFNANITFFVRWGNLIARIALFSSILILLNTIVKSKWLQVGNK